MMVARLPRDEDGFTLLEMMVVVFVIGVLMAIALPTFLGARQQAQDRRAHADLGNALVTAKIWLADTGGYAGFDESRAEALEPSLTWVALGDPAVGEVAVGLSSASDVHLVVESGSGTFFCLHDDVGVGTTYGSGATYAAVNTEVLCSGPAW